MSICRQLYGLLLETNFPFTYPLPTVSGEPTLRFRLLAGTTPKPSPPGATPVSLAQGRLILERLPAGHRLRIQGVGTFDLRQQEILCFPSAPDLEAAVEICLLGMVLAFWLELQGFPTLHASAVVVEGRGAAFLGANQGGKSSLAAALVEAGHALLTDDLLPLEIREDAVLGRPGYPQLRAWPDLAERLVADPESLPRLHPDLEKRRITVGEAGRWGRFHDQPVPLARIYLPERRDGLEAARLETISPRDATVELIRYSFLARLVAAAGLEGPRLLQFADAATQVPVRRLVYPAGWERLDEAYRLVLGDLTG